MKKLVKYNQKRDFAKTDEPVGKSEKPKAAVNDAKQLRFVVQHHIAKREHYDLRLEYGGVLISFALPKGPSFNPADKRLAVRVENHPLGYASFEGTIPKGEYGGGVVMVWDNGIWIPQSNPSAGFESGRLKFVLKGERLRGKWILTRLKQGGGKTDNWLLIKEKDEFSRSEAGINGFNTSVKSNRTMREIEDGKKIGRAQKNKKKINIVVKNPFLKTDIQLAKLEKSLPATGDWLYEMKYDGYRIIAFVEGETVRLLSRNGKDYTKDFKSIANSLAQKFEGRTAVLDGEVVITDKDGKTDFQALQSWFKNPQSEPIYVVFDLLALDGEDLRAEPLIFRKKLLGEIMKNSPSGLHICKYSESFDKNMLKSICGHGFEGIVAKKADSPYSGTRNGDWIKLKCAQRQEFVIGGYTRTQKKTKGISSLLLGYYAEGKLVYAGSVGTGITEKAGEELEKKFLRFRIESSPFLDYSVEQRERDIVWLKAEFAAEIQFAEWTHDNLLRHPSFKGLRVDKHIKDIVLETVENREAEKKDKSEKSTKTKAASQKENSINEKESPSKVKSRKSMTKVEQTVLECRITNPDKLLFTNPDITKSEVAEYYQKVSKRMLPLIKERLISLVNCPKGINQPCFFKKHITEDGDGIKVVDINGGSEKKQEYFYISAPVGIVSRVQMNAIEFHVWGSRASNLEKPDMMVFDLDPDEGMNLNDVRQGVMDLCSILKELNLAAFLKTSGGKGYHVVVPFMPSSDWSAFRLFAKNIAEAMVQKWPNRYTSNIRKENRKGKIFIDWIRNTRGATSIAPYSVRAKNGAKVSMPISFSELNEIAPDGITMSDAVKRLQRKDPWADFFLARQVQKIKQ